VSSNLIFGGTRWDDISRLQLQACNLVRWLLHMCVMAFPHVCHDSFTCVPWLIHMCAMSCQMGRDETISQDCDYKPASWYNDCFACVSWRVHMCAMTRIHVRHDSFTCVQCLVSCVDMRRYLKIAITSLHVGTMTASHVRHNITYSHVRLRVAGSWKLYVSFAKEPCKRDYILQKRPIIFLWWYTFTCVPYLVSYRVAKTHRIP